MSSPPPKPRRPRAPNGAMEDFETRRLKCGRCGALDRRKAFHRHEWIEGGDGSRSRYVTCNHCGCSMKEINTPDCV